MTSRKILRSALPILCLLFGVGAAAAQTIPTGYDGWFLRGELGGQVLATDTGYWHGPGGSDPRITFSLNDATGITGAVAVGYDWGNGVRLEKSIGIVTGMQVDGTFLSASDGSTSGHATDIHAPVSAVTAIGNLYIEPLKMAGHDSPFQPFLTGGLGIAVVSVGEWTRNNPTPPAEPTRSWSGSSRLNFAWQVGGGASLALDSLGAGGGYLDFTYRYTDLGQASGGTDPVDPPPRNSPQEPYNFRLASHAVTVGLRMPLSE